MEENVGSEQLKRHYVNAVICNQWNSRVSIHDALCAVEFQKELRIPVYLGTKEIGEVVQLRLDRDTLELVAKIEMQKELLIPLKDLEYNTDWVFEEFMEEDPDAGDDGRRMLPKRIVLNRRRGR